MTTIQFQTDAKALIDDLQAVYANAEIGNEFKIITQIFLYKFLNDKFAYEAKRIDPALATADSWSTSPVGTNKHNQELTILHNSPRLQAAAFT